ncbi:MAG: insulinase family protein [Acidobacteriota bacterium]
MKFRKIFDFFAAALLLSITFSLSATAQSVTAKPRQEKLLNGLKMLMWSDPKADKVELKVRIHSGSAFDPQGKEGVMKLLAENIFATQDAREYYKDELGGSLEVTSGYDYIQITATAKPEQFLTLLESVSRAVSNPAIDKETTARLRSEQVERVKVLEKDRAYVADMASAKRLLGTFPYGRAANGTTDSLARIDWADLVDARERFLTADNATLAIYGNFDSDLAYRAARRNFGSWLKSDKRVPSTFRQPDAPMAAAQTIASPLAGSFEVRYIARGYSRNDKDFPASIALASIVERRIKAKIPTEHTADVSVRSEGHVLPGVIMVRMSGTTAPDPGKTEANDVIASAIQAPITNAEFTAAKADLAAEWGRRDAIDSWLDIDTFKTVSLDAERQTVANISLGDVQRAADILSKQPVAVVLVSTPKAVN